MTNRMQDLTITAGYMTIPTYVFGDVAGQPKAILYLHGRATSREMQFDPCKRLTAATGLPIVLPEYSGHGDNPPIPFEATTPAMHVSEVMAVYDWLHREQGVKEIIVYGSSYGAHMAANIMHYRQPAACILQAPTLIFDEDAHTTRADIPTYVGKINAATTEQLANNIARMTEGYTGRLLVLRSEHDEKVEPHVVNAWKDVFPDVSLVTVAGAIHSIRESSEEAKQCWLKAVTDFIR